MTKSNGDLMRVIIVGIISALLFPSVALACGGQSGGLWILSAVMLILSLVSIGVILAIQKLLTTELKLALAKRYFLYLFLLQVPATLPALWMLATTLCIKPPQQLFIEQVYGITAMLHFLLLLTTILVLIFLHFVNISAQTRTRWGIHGVNIYAALFIVVTLLIVFANLFVVPRLPDEIRINSAIMDII